MRTPFFVVAALCAAFLTTPASAAPETPTIDRVLDGSYALHGLSSVALSPDGRSVAYIDTVRNIASPTDPTPHSAIRIVPSGGGSAVRLTAGDGSKFFDEGNPVWAPDGNHVAFLSDARSPGQAQIFVADANGTHVKQIGKLKGDVQDLRFMPGGKTLSFLYIPNAPALAGPLAPAARDAGVVQSTIYEQRLATIDPSSGALHLLTPADSYVYEYDWAPDAHAAVVTYANGDGNNNWWIAQLATVAAAGGALDTIYKPALQVAIPRWSPDGKSIAFIEGLMSDEGSTGGDVYTISPNGGEPKDVTPSFHGSAAALDWIASTPSLLVTYHREGSLRLAKLDTQSDVFADVTANQTSTIFDAQLARDGKRIAFVRQSFSEAPEVYAGTLGGDVKPITSVNAGIRTYWGNAQSVTWTNDGYNVQGWLLAPLNVDPSKKYPMVVVVHGGPAAENLAMFPQRQTAALASQGYYVFMPNPRGSFGQGEKFTAANVKDFGYGDLRDILTGIDAAAKVAPIDPNRVGMYGWSYGGYMTMWTVTQTQRFKAAVAGAGVANWQSYYGQNGIDMWMIPYFGASVYDDPQVYAKSSPITFIKNVKTPTLVLHGERDTEVPAPQGYEFWHALKTIGVPTQLVIYPNEGHGVAKPADQKDIARRLVGWFDRYLKGS
ncbi:MAG: alpha/beta fold hydrolase [Vulcanimicrobiaceae bacterium]